MGVLFSGGSSKAELQKKRFDEVSKMSVAQLKRHMAKRMKGADSNGYVARMKQSRTNRAINHPV